MSKSVAPQLLHSLHTEIDQRVESIRTDNPDWLCRMGCDACCHRLAEIPELTEPEWHLLQETLSTWTESALQKLQLDLAAIAVQSTRPIVCPLLDQANGTCRVYNARPVACRTYGYYVQRDKGLYCQAIDAEQTSGVWQTVVWGNQDVVAQRLKTLGESRALTDWFSLWKCC